MPWGEPVDMDHCLQVLICSVLQSFCLSQSHCLPSVSLSSFPPFYLSPFLSYMKETQRKIKKKKKTRVIFLLCNLNSHSEYGGATTQGPACHLANWIISYLDLPFASISSFLYSFASVSSDLWSQIIFMYLLWIF